MVMYLKFFDLHQGSVMKRFFSLLFLIILVSDILFPEVIFALEEGDDDAIFDVEGSAQVKNDDFSHARNAAIQDALLKAVEEATGRLLSPIVMVEKAQAVKTGIFVKAGEYIKNYRIITEKTSVGVYTANIKATVSLTGIKNDLHSMGILKDLPAVPKTAPVTITLRGIRRHADYVKFMDFIRTGVKGVEEVRGRSMEWGTAKMEADVRGGARAIVAELARAKQFPIQINMAGDSAVEVVFLR